MNSEVECDTYGRVIHMEAWELRQAPEKYNTSGPPWVMACTCPLPPVNSYLLGMTGTCKSSFHVPVFILLHGRKIMQFRGKLVLSIVFQEKIWVWCRLSLLYMSVFISFSFYLSIFPYCELESNLPCTADFPMTLQQLMTYLSFLTAVGFVGYSKLRHFSANDPNLCVFFQSYP